MNEISVLIARAQKPLINAHAGESIKARDLNFSPNLYLHQYFVYASSEGSGHDESPDHSLLSDAISTEISCAAKFISSLHECFKDTNLRI